MRILVLNYEFPPLGGGGGSASAVLAEQLAARGHELQVLTSRGPGTSGDRYENGYLVRRVPTGRRSASRASFASMAAYILAGLLPGWRLVRSWRPDVMHAHFAVPTGALAFGLWRLTGVPYALTVHLGDVPGGVPEKTDRWFRFVRPLTPAIWRGAAQVVAVSEHTRQLALQQYDVAISVIPNGVLLPEAGTAIGEVGDPPKLVFAGRFQPQKNLTALVDALQTLKDLSWSCMLIGDGPQADELRRRISHAELNERIQLTGWLPRERVDQLMAGADILVMPSRSEGLPVVGIQALAHGLAIVASAAGGLTELVKDQVNGRLCAVGDTAGFASGLRSLLEDRGRLRQMKAASLEMAQRYDVQGVADAYERVLLQAVGGR